MKRLNLQLLKDNILSKASHNRMKQLSNVFYGIPPYLHDNLTVKNQAYLQAFQYHVLCEYVTHPQFRPKVNPTKSLLIDKQMSNYAQTKSKKELNFTYTPIQKRMLAVIKKLGQNKDTYFAYIEAQETIVMMTAEEAQKNKKYLIYIYKWITNQKQWYNQQIKNLGVQLKKTVVSKINEGNEKLEEQIKLQKQLQALQQKIQNDIQIETKRENQKVQQVISNYKEKTQTQNVADKNKQ